MPVTRYIIRVNLRFTEGIATIKFFSEAYCNWEPQ